MDSVNVSGFHVGSGVDCVWISGFRGEAGLGADSKFAGWAFLSIFWGESGSAASRRSVFISSFKYLKP